MKSLLVIFITLFLLSLIHACYGDGGSGGGTSSDDTILHKYLLTNQFIYELTRSDGTAPSESVVSKWIKSIGSKLGVTIRHTTRLQTMLINRVNYLRGKVKKYTGSASRRRYLQQTWELVLENDEIHTELEELSSKVEELEDELCELRQEVSYAHQDIKELQAEKHQVESELMTTTSTLELLQTENQCLREACQTLATSRCPESKVSPAASLKPMEDCSDSHRRRRKREISKSCDTSLQWLQDQGYLPVSISVVSMVTGKTESIDLPDSALAELFRHEEELDEDDLDAMNMMLYIKDWYNISHEAYHELAKVCKEMPRHYRLKQRISELNSLWDIKPTPNDTHGVQQSLEDRLRVRMQILISISDTSAKFMTDKKVNVKLSGDGTKIGKRLHVVIFTFTLLEEEQYCSSMGNHILAIFKQPESYNCLKSALADIISDVKRLTEIDIDGIKFRITYFLGGDWKFLATVTGIDSASSTYSCIWCKCKKDERGDVHHKWSLMDPTNGARTIEENQKIGEQSRKQYNVSNPPLFPTIPLKNVVIDNLHLFLRVSDVLIDLLIVELRRQDAIEKVKKFSSTDLTRYKHIQSYQNFVSSLGIPGFEFYVGRSSKELKCRSLTGPEKLKVVKKIDIQALLPTFEASQCQAIQHLWNELLALNTIISKPASELSCTSISEFEQRARKWGEDFVSVYQRRNITPYIHAFMNHVGEFMTIHGSILPFNQQALEKKNDVITKMFFRSSNHQGDTSLCQILEKQNRIEHFESVGIKKIKLFVVQCSNCQEKGHNRLTCEAPCKRCKYTPYRNHLHGVKKTASCDKEN